MKLTVEVKPTPTFKQYVDSGEATIPSEHTVQRILVNVDWKTITFFSDEFKLNYKLPTKEEYVKAVRNIKKLLSKPCQCRLEIESKTVCNVILDSASDADESFMEFTESDKGWDRTR